MTERRLPNLLLRWIGALRRRPRAVAPVPAAALPRTQPAVGPPPAPPMAAVRMAALLARLPGFLAERRRPAGWGTGAAAELPLWVGRPAETLAPGPRRVAWRGVLAQRPAGVLRPFPGPVALREFVRRRKEAYRVVTLGAEGGAAESAPAAVWPPGVAPAGAVPTRPWPPAIYREEVPTYEPEETLPAPASRTEIPGGRPAPAPSPLGRPAAGLPALAAAVRSFFRDLGTRLRPAESPLSPPAGPPLSPMHRGEPVLREGPAPGIPTSGPPPERPSRPVARPPTMAVEVSARFAEKPEAAGMPPPPAGPLRPLWAAMRRLFAPEARALPERVPSGKELPPAPAPDLPPPPRRLRQAHPAREELPPAPAQDLPPSRREVLAAPAATGGPDVGRPIGGSPPSGTTLPVAAEALPGPVAAIPPAPTLPTRLAGRERPGEEPAPLPSARSEEGGPVWRAAGPAAQTLARRVREGLRRLGAGTPLPSAQRAFLEQVLRRPLGDVRLHTGPAAAAVTGEIGAAAATVGRHVILSPTRMELGSPRGLALLAHEVVHALQRVPTGEGTPTTREEEAQALHAEEQVRRALEQPASPFPPLALPLGRPFLPPGVSSAAVRTPPFSTVLMPGPIRAVPAVGPLRRAPAEEPAAPPAAPAPSTPAAGPAQAGPASVDVEALTEEVLRRIRHRLELEREWRGL